jgi:hypothetical protein
MADYNGNSMLPPLSAPHLFAAVDLCAAYDTSRTLVTEVPPLSPTLRTLTLYIRLTNWLTHEGTEIAAFNPPSSLRAVTLHLYGVVDPELEPQPHHSLPFGILTHVIDRLIPYLRRIRLTFINVFPDVAPALGLIRPFSHSLARVVNRTSEIWLAVYKVLVRKLLRRIAQRLYEHATTHGWSDEKLESATTNVQAITYGAWKEDMDDEVWTAWEAFVA